MDKILVDRAVLEQALKALEKADRISGYRNNWAEVNSLIAALEQPPRQPLTEEQIDSLAMDEDGLPNSPIEFARAFERAHGIGA